MKITKERIDFWKKAIEKDEVATLVPSEIAQLLEICDLAQETLDRRWRPIEEAPKDGGWILAWSPRFYTGDNETIPRICRWSMQFEVWKSVSGSAAPSNQPTHFQPLPTPPSGAKP